MTTDLFPRQAAGVTETLDERARKAVHAFRALQPVLTAYARAMTGRNDVRVEMSATDNGSTDGKRIFLRPPLALGDNSKHDRNICNKRGADGYQLCEACAVRESVLRSIYHEISHIAFGSFERVSDFSKQQTVEFAIKDMRSEWAEMVRERIKHFKPDSYVQLAKCINEFLPFLLNCMEDARVDAQMFKVRPGTRHMFEAETKKIFEEGFENRNPITGEYETKKWIEAPLNSQLMIGTYLKASGYEYGNYLHPQVVEALDDSEVTGIVEQIPETKLASDVYRLALHVFARYRQLGFFATDQDQNPPPPQPDPQGEPDESDEQQQPDEQQESDSSGDSGQSQEGTPDSDADSDSEGDSSGDSEADEEGDEGQGSDDTGQAEDAGSSGGAPQPEPQADESPEDGSDAGEGEPEAGGVDDESGDESSEQGDGDVQDVDESEGGADHSDDDHEAGNSSDSDPSSGYEGTGEDDADSAGQSADSEWNEGSGPEQGGSGEASGNEEASADSSSGDDTPVDQGADDGYGGTDLEGDLGNEVPEMGEPDDIAEVISIFGDHDEKPKSFAAEAEAHAIDKAVIQGIYFNKPSENVYGVREHYIDKHCVVDGVDYSVGFYEVDPARAKRTGKRYEDEKDETILQPVLLEVRRTFDDNQRGKQQRGKKSGKINPAALGRRAWNDDPRLFTKSTRPGKKSYAVILHMDLSGSTVGRNLALEKRAVMLQAEVLDRAGIPFAIVGHTGNYMRANYGDNSRELVVEIYHIKDFDQPWEEAQYALQEISGHGVNLDGHALEYLRKLADTRRETDKIIMYYSDGKMPSTNHDEELEILQDEIKRCRDLKYTLLGVGIRTDSPTRHGLPTVQVDRDADLSKVVQHLGQRLSETR